MIRLLAVVVREVDARFGGDVPIKVNENLTVGLVDQVITVRRGLELLFDGEFFFVVELALTLAVSTAVSQKDAQACNGKDGKQPPPEFRLLALGVHGPILPEMERPQPATMREKDSSRIHTTEPCQAAGRRSSLLLRMTGGNWSFHYIGRRRDLQGGNCGDMWCLLHQSLQLLVGEFT